MKLLKLSVKNIINSWWRSLTLGTLIFLVSFILVLLVSFIHTIKTNMENAIVYAVTGDIQVRPGKTKENDMFPLKDNWNDITYLSADILQKVEKAVSSLYPAEQFTRMARINALIISDYDKGPAMLIGIDPKSMGYRKAFHLSQGNFLDPANSNQIILSTSAANKLKVKPGDSVGIMTQTKDGYMVDSALTVAGIGEIDILGGFGFYPAYVDLQSAQYLLGFENGEASDFILYEKDRASADRALVNVKTELQKQGITDGTVKFSTWREMGGFIRSIITIWQFILYTFLIVMMIIICILIFNLIFMIGLERRQEIGTLRAIGFARGQIIRIFMSEIMMITFFSTLIGTFLGIQTVIFIGNFRFTPAKSFEYVMGRDFMLRFSAPDLIPGLVLILVFSVLAAYYPSYKAASQKPAETLKEI